MLSYGRQKALAHSNGTLGQVVALSDRFQSHTCCRAETLVLTSATSVIDSKASVFVAMLSFQYMDHLSFCTLGCSVMLTEELPPLKRLSRLTMHPAGTCGSTGPVSSCLPQHSKTCCAVGTPATVTLMYSVTLATTIIASDAHLFGGRGPA